MITAPCVIDPSGSLVGFNKSQIEDSFLAYRRGGVSIPKRDRLSILKAVYFAFTENLAIYIGPDISHLEQLQLEKVTREFKPRSSKGLLWFRSSGSTGVPKFILHSGESLAQSAKSIRAVIEFTSDSRMLHFFPTHYMSGILNCFVLPWQLEMEIFLAPVFNFATPRVLSEFCSSEKSNLFWASPNMVRAITLGTTPEDMEHVVAVINATGPISHNDVRNFVAKFPKTRLVNTYGSTEQLFIAATSPLDKWEGVGRTLPGVKVEISSSGIISIESQTTCLCVMDSSFSLREPTSLETQDLGEWLSNGNLELIGRTGDYVSIGGEQVNLAELELEFSNIEGVVDCGFELRGNTSWSEVVLVTEISDQQMERRIETQLREIALRQIGQHIRFEFRPLPRLSNGKPDKRIMRQI